MFVTIRESHKKGLFKVKYNNDKDWQWMDQKKKDDLVHGLEERKIEIRGK